MTGTTPSQPRTIHGQLARTIFMVITSPWRFFKFVCFSIGFAVLAAAAAAGFYAYDFMRGLPDFEKTDFAAVKARAAARIAQRAEDKKRPRPWTELKDVSRVYLYSIVMSEDSTFFEHEGINYDAVVNAAIMNLRKKSYEYGASTISQQVVKNLYLENEKSLVRKARELAITYRLEKRFTKNEILELYFNLAETGPDLYGMGEAARHYFGKPASEINAAEGAFIALMLPSPRKLHFSIFENRNLPPKARKKLRRVLGDLAAFDLVSPAQYREYVRYDYFADGSAAPPRRPASR